MKKAILSTMVVLALVLSMAVASFAAVTSTASYATTAPVIDGQIDAIWETTAAQNTEASSIDEDEATGYTKILWDAGNLYFLAVVTDATPVDAGDNSCTNGVNFWVSEGNTQAEDFTCTATVAIYDENGKMVAVNGEALVLTTGDSETIAVENFVCEDGMTYTAKCFVWDSLLGMNTIFEAVIE